MRKLLRATAQLESRKTVALNQTRGLAARPNVRPQLTNLALARKHLYEPKAWQPNFEPEHRDPNVRPQFQSRDGAEVEEELDEPTGPLQRALRRIQILEERLRTTSSYATTADLKRHHDNELEAAKAKYYLDLRTAQAEMGATVLQVFNDHARAKSHEGARHKTDHRSGKQVVQINHLRLGILRLDDYCYIPAPGDIDSPQSFEYDVVYAVVKGLTFDACKSGKLDDEMMTELKRAVSYLVEKERVCGVTGDCGFMLNYQEAVRRMSPVPTFLSPLLQLPSLLSTFDESEGILVMTAHADSLKQLFATRMGSRLTGADRARIYCSGCEDVKGFEAVDLGLGPVNTDLVSGGVVAKVQEALQKFPDSRAILLECTELSPYSNEIRYATGLPVFDAITCADFFTMGFDDNPRFGLQFMKSKEESKYGLDRKAQLRAAEKAQKDFHRNKTQGPSLVPRRKKAFSLAA